MIKKLNLFILFLCFLTASGSAQSFVKTSELFQRTDENSRTGQLNIVQNPAIDTLINRYILMSRKNYNDYGYYGMDGFRIQIYYSNKRSAKEEAAKARQEFITKFPGIPTYALFAEPAYYKIQVGDFRTKTEATKLFMLISKEFPDAILLPNVFINFPDLNNNKL